MSTNGDYGWKPRKVEPFTCFSGRKVMLKRPGPEFIVRSARYARTYSRLVTERPPNTNGDEPLGDFFEELAKLDDEQLAALLLFADQLLCAILDSPKLVPNPDPDKNQIGPRDIPDLDFWQLFIHGMGGFTNIAVPVGDTEVKVSDLESFREGAGVQGLGVDSASVSPDTEQLVGDQGLVDGAGV